MDDIARYGAYLANEKNASQNTISSYLRDVTQFAEYLQNTQSCGLRLATGDMILQLYVLDAGTRKIRLFCDKVFGLRQILL